MQEVLTDPRLKQDAYSYLAEQVTNGKATKSGSSSEHELS